MLVLACPSTTSCAISKMQEKLTQIQMQNTATLQTLTMIAYNVTTNVFKVDQQKIADKLSNELLFISTLNHVTFIRWREYFFRLCLTNKHC